MKKALNRRSVLALSAATLVAAASGRPANASAKHHDVTIKSFAFEPSVITVKTGDTITWTNLDIAPHTATDLDHEWDTGELARTDSGKITVTPEMDGEYFCVFHPHMRGHIEVTDA